MQIFPKKNAIFLFKERILLFFPKALFPIKVGKKG